MKAAASTAAQPHWVQPDGAPIACRDKLRTLDENWIEVRTVLQDAFEDALLIGVDEQRLRTALMTLVQALQSPFSP